MLTISVFLSALALTAHSASWNYEDRGNNVSHWVWEQMGECHWSAQSPIDIPLESLTAVCDKPLELKWTSQHSHYAVRNAGHSILATPFEISHVGGGDISGLEVLHHRNDTNIRLINSFYDTYNSPINKEYCFDSVHCHWGRENSEGSEHTFNGQSYPLECHLVHYSCDYYVAGEAITDYATGNNKIDTDDHFILAVVGVMFEIGDPNPVLEKILNNKIIDNIYENKANDNPEYLEMYYTDFDIKDLLPESREMVAYRGSLTTPPCFETVRWHLLKQPMTVSEGQMAQLRRLLEGSIEDNENQAPNFRPPQPLNGREVYSCQEDVDNLSVVEEEDIVEDQEERVDVVVQEDKDSEMWKNIGISFIVLFGVVSLCCIAISCAVCYRHFTVSISRKLSNYEQAEEKMETNQ